MSASAPVQSQKTCVMCGADVSNQKRVKDHEGRYFCHPCWESAAAAAKPATPNSVPVAMRPNDAALSTERSGLSSSEKTLLLTGIALGLLLLISLVYFLFLRDRWENQNADALIAYKMTAETAARAGKLDEAKSSYGQFLQLLGDHKVRDTSLQAAISTAEKDARHTDELIASKEQARRVAEVQAAKAKQDAARVKQDAEAQAAAKRETDQRALRERSQWKPIEPTPTDIVDVKYDKFANKTVVGTKNEDASWRMLYRVEGTQYEQPFHEGGWGMYAWMYTVIKGHTVTERPASVGLCFIERTGEESLGMFRDSTTGDDAYVLIDDRSFPFKLQNVETHSALIEMPTDTAIAVANAKSVEAKIGTLQFKFTPTQLGSLKKVLQAMGAIP